jgi:signal transduction histidine kinase
MTDARGGDPRPRGAWWREAAVTAAAFALCLLGGMLHSDGRGLSAPPLAAYGVAVVSCAVLPVRHRAPLAAMAATTAVGVLVTPLGLLLSPLIVAPAVVTAYSLTARTRRHAASAVALTSVALLVAATPLLGALSWKDASRVAAVAAFPLLAGVLGHSVQTRRAYLAAVEERARRAEETREREARRRVAEERVRIARELHDLVAHQITLANAQATVAAHLFDVRPEQTRQSLDELVRTTRDALDELRATVGLLRQPDEEAGAAAGPGSAPGSASGWASASEPASGWASGSGPASAPGSAQGAAPSEPAPGLSRLPTLLESFRRAGLRVERVEQGTPRPLPPGVDLTAYRIVQEALTNVTKHAGTPEARVRLAWDRGRLTLTVADDGPGGRTGADAGTGPGASAAGDRTGTGARTGPAARTGPGGSARTAPGAARDRASGYGLIGMRERATAVGGRLTAGPRPEGGFLVIADLPFRQRGDAQDAADVDAADVPDGWDATGGGDGEDGDAR